MLAALVCFVAFVLQMARGGAVRAEAIGSFAIARFSVGHTAIAIVPIVGPCCGRAGGQEETEGRGGQGRFTEKRAELERVKFHKITSRSPARAGDRGCILEGSNTCLNRRLWCGVRDWK